MNDFINRKKRMHYLKQYCQSFGFIPTITAEVYSIYRSSKKYGDNSKRNYFDEFHRFHSYIIIL